MNTKITVVIPTFNHPLYIKFIIDNCIKTYKGNLFSFEIHDSSDNNETEYLAKNTEGIKYYKYSPEISADVKSHEALSNAKNSHLYLMGDGMTPDFNLLEQFLIKSNFYFYDLFGILPSSFLTSKINKKMDIRPNTKYEYDNYLEFSKRFFYELTLYGGSIISKRILNYINNNNLFEKYQYESRYCYAHISSVFDALSTKEYSFSVSFLDSVKINPLKKSSTWMKKETFFPILMNEFYADIQKNPGFNSSTIKEIVKSKNSFAFTIRTIINLRINGILNFTEYLNYKETLNKYNSQKYFMIFFCFIPKWIFRLLKMIKKGIR